MLEYSEPPFIPFEVLDKLIAAGLGDTPRCKIKPTQFESAMQGQAVKVLRSHEFGCRRLPDRPLCPSCGKDEARVRATQKDARSWVCRACYYHFTA